MVVKSPNTLTCANQAEERAFIEASIEVWRTRNATRFPHDVLEMAAKTVAREYGELLSNTEDWQSRPLELEGASCLLRQFLGVLIKVGLSLASSGIDQAFVHAGLTQRNAPAIIWLPDRYDHLSKFTRRWVEELYARIAELEGISRTPRPATSR